MKIRRRNWWLRRMALGLAFASFAAPAAAQPDASTGSAATATVTAGGWTGAVDSSGIPVSAGIPSGDEPFLVDPYLANGAAPARTDSGWAVSRDEAIALGLGALALALALGLAVGYARRPRIAGL